MKPKSYLSCLSSGCLLNQIIPRQEIAVFVLTSIFVFMHLLLSCSPPKSGSMVNFLHSIPWRNFNKKKYFHIFKKSELLTIPSVKTGVEISNFDRPGFFFNVRKSHVVECAMSTRFSSGGLGKLRDSFLKFTCLGSVLMIQYL